MVKRAFLGILLLALIMFGCSDDEQITGPQSPEMLNVQLYAQQDTLRGFDGRRIDVRVWAEVKDAVGRKAVNQQVFFAYTAGGERIETGTATTGEDGTARLSFTLECSKGMENILIQADCEGFTDSKSLIVMGSAAPAEIRMPANRALYARSGRIGSISFTGAVVDSHGIGIPGVKLEMRLEPATPDIEPFGALHPVEATDEDGKAEIVYEAQDEYGSVIVDCRIDCEDESLGSIGARTRIDVIEVQNRGRFLELRPEREVVAILHDSTKFVDVTAYAQDDEGAPVSNLDISFSTNLGVIEPLGTTDSNGMTVVEFNNNGQAGSARIVASVGIEGWDDAATTIECRKLSPLNASLRLAADRDFIFADNGITTANLTAVLECEPEPAFIRYPLEFSSSHGILQPVVVMDSLGVARNVFIDDGLPAIDENGDPFPAVIAVSLPGTDLRDSVEIYIRENPQVQRLYLSVEDNELLAGGCDSTAVKVTALKSDGVYAPDGTIIHFDAVYGAFSQPAAEVSGGEGVAETVYYSGGHLGQEIIGAAFISNADTVRSACLNIWLKSGIPDQFIVDIDSDTLVAGDNETMATIRTTVLDACGFPVNGFRINYSTDNGSITSMCETDENGIAIARYFPGRTAGVATITAHCEVANERVTSRHNITIVSAKPNSMRVWVDPREFRFSGASCSHSTARAEIFDRWGNPIDYPISVVFGLINEPEHPEGCSFGQFYEDNFVSRSSNGIAMASVNPGTRIGGKLLRAYTWPDSAHEPDNTIQAVTTFAIVSGPPFQIDIDVDNEPIDVGGGAWSLEVSARVWDIHRNPVGDQIPVIFSVDPELATIDYAHTGNENRNGESIEGIAFAEMVYQSFNTFESITISSRVQSAQGEIEGRRAYILPLQQGELALEVEPGNWAFGNENDHAEISCTATLIDGHGVLINNAPIHFTTTRGFIYWFNDHGDYLRFHPNPAIRLTGERDEDGCSVVWLRGLQDEYFFDENANEARIEINARVSGMNLSAEPREAVLWRR